MKEANMTANFGRIEEKVGKITLYVGTCEFLVVVSTVVLGGDKGRVGTGTLETNVVPVH